MANPFPPLPPSPPSKLTSTTYNELCRRLFSNEFPWPASIAGTPSLQAQVHQLYVDNAPPVTWKHGDGDKCRAFATGVQAAILAWHDAITAKYLVRLLGLSNDIRQTNNTKAASLSPEEIAAWETHQVAVRAARTQEEDRIIRELVGYYRPAGAEAGAPAAAAAVMVGALVAGAAAVADGLAVTGVARAIEAAAEDESKEAFVM